MENVIREKGHSCTKKGKMLTQLILYIALI